MRPDPPLLVPAEKDFEFFMNRSEYRIDSKPVEGLVVYLYGDTIDGNSVCVKTGQFLPYMYIRYAEEQAAWGLDEYTILMKELNTVLKDRTKKSWRENKACGPDLIKGFVVEHGKDLRGYHGESPEKFVKIYLAYPKLVRECRMLLEYPFGRSKRSARDYLPEIPNWWPSQLRLPVANPLKDADLHRGQPHLFDIFEANLDFTMRFQVDHKIRATGWVKLQKGMYSMVPENERTTTVQMEIQCIHTGIGYSSRSTKETPPICAFSYDAECKTGPNNTFPR